MAARFGTFEAKRFPLVEREVGGADFHPVVVVGRAIGLPGASAPAGRINFAI